MRRLALCIGNQDYEILPKLDYAVADATEMEKALKSLGFDTMLGTNLDRAAMANILSVFNEKIEGYDAILVYYAGHGFQIDNYNILAPIDLNIHTGNKEIRFNAFPLQDILEIMCDNPEQTKIVILDACRENLGYRGTFNTFAPISAPRGSIIAFSTSPGKYSKESKEAGHGKYTEALLRYIELPRVEIETVFKRVRESLSADSGGTQVPWEHTSLIGAFYFNPNTIYDGTSYSQEALEDKWFRFIPGSKIKLIVDGLKSHNWPTQEAAIKQVSDIQIESVSINELFVLGRNIYQAADGSSFACRRFIDEFGNNNKIPDEAKVHILNGMAYEIYYNSEGKLRSQMKLGYYQKIIYYLEYPSFYSSKEFISSLLCKIENRPIYIPGQDEIMFIQVIIDYDNDLYSLKEIRYQGRNILRWDENDPIGFGYMRRRSFEELLAMKLVAPLDALRFQYNTDEVKKETYITFETGNFELSF